MIFRKKINKDSLTKRKLEKKLWESEERYRLLFESAPDVICTVDCKGFVTSFNPAAIKMAGYKNEEAMGKHFSELGSTLKKDIPKYFKIFNSYIRGKKIPPFVINWKHKNGDIRHAEIHIAPIKKRLRLIGLLAVVRDITDRKKVENELRISEGHYRSLFENSIDGIYRSTKDGKYINANPSLVKMLGYKSKAELLSINIATKLYKDPSERPPTDKRNRIFETRLKKKNGDILWVKISSRVLYDENKLPYYEGIVRDITDQKISQNKIEYLSFHDKLTGLYNRAFFEEELKRLDTARKYPLSLVYGDINGLKSINDRYGHQEGDRLLCEVARIIKICFRKEDLVARWGGDEFIIILPNTDIDSANEIIDRINSRCLVTKFKRKPVSIALGAATKFEQGMSIASVIREAENKMYEEKGKVRHSK